MIKKNENKELKEIDLKDNDNFCEECKKYDESVLQNFILTGFKICKSCRTSKTIFPVQLQLPIGSAFILLITKETETIAIIKKDKKITPKDLKLDFKFKICFVDIINEAKIQN